MARPRFSGHRMNKEWNFIPGVSFALTGNATVAAGGLQPGSATVLRMLGEYIIVPTAVPVALDNADVTVAIGVVSSDAFAAGAGSLPDPGAEPEYPWLYWASHPLFFPSADATAGGAGISVRRGFDVKSMRKIKPRETLVLVGQYANVVGDPPLTLSIANTRVLLADV